MRVMKYSLSALIYVLLLGSCSGYLDTRPSNGLDYGDAVRNETDLLTALRGAYSGLVSADYYGAGFIVYGEVKGDDVQARIAGQRTESAYRFSWREVNSPEGLWRSPYEVIRRTNFVLEAIERGDVAWSVAVDDMKGQALALRALCHFNLLLMYGGPYLKDGGTSEGVPLVRTVLEADALPARSSVAEGYRMVKEDLREALQLTAEEKKDGYINRWAVKGLLARVSLYEGEWDTCFHYAADVIGHGPYELVGTKDYIDSWKEAYTTESVFDAAVSSKSSTNKELLGYLASASGYNCLIATASFKALLDEDPDDVRHRLLTKRGGYWFINKYPGRGGALPVNNVRIVRLSDLYLMAAEAALKKAERDQDGADGYLDAVRRRANPSVGKVKATEELILKERRKELVLEGHRFFDGMRLGKRLVREGGWHFLGGTDLVNPSWDDYRIVAPIPQAEMDVNPNIRGHQNKGY